MSVRPPAVEADTVPSLKKRKAARLRSAALFVAGVLLGILLAFAPGLGDAAKRDSSARAQPQTPPLKSPAPKPPPGP